MAFGQLAPGAPQVEGHEVNLYRYDTSSSSTTYVATVDKRDYPSEHSAAWWLAQGLSSIPTEPALAPEANWYTTPEGRYLLFTSTSELTSYSTAQKDPSDCPTVDIQEKVHFGHCAEVYRYDSQEGTIICISCDRSGAQPVSNASFAHSAGTGEAPAASTVRAMTDEGSEVFFNTADALVPEDTNNTQDVYEWEAQGRYGCEVVAGCISLISSGQDSVPSFFLGASGNGTDVFFGTHARLVAQDTDTAGDLYDARIDGGFRVVGGTGPCEGDACQSPSPSPIDSTPGSLTFSGAGNIVNQKKIQTKPKFKRTNAQKLAGALKTCRKKRKRSTRKTCEAKARERYGRTAGRHVKRLGNASTRGGQ
jgi:hypothetical protein